MVQWQPADGRFYDNNVVRFDGRLRYALVSDEVLDDRFDPERPPPRDDEDMPQHLARQLGWRQRSGGGGTFAFMAMELNELFNGFPIAIDDLSVRLADTALQGTSELEILDLVFSGPKRLRTAELPDEVCRYDHLAKHTRPLVQKALRAQLRTVFDTWNNLDLTEVSKRLRPGYRPKASPPAEPVTKRSRAERAKDREGMNFQPPYR